MENKEKLPKITLVWMNKIRKRLDEYEKQDKDYGVILDFLFPIIEFGSSEEKRINETYNKDNKTNKDNKLQ